MLPMLYPALRNNAALVAMLTGSGGGAGGAARAAPLPGTVCDNCRRPCGRPGIEPLAQDLRRLPLRALLQRSLRRSRVACAQESVQGGGGPARRKNGDEGLAYTARLVGFGSDVTEAGSHRPPPLETRSCSPTRARSLEIERTAWCSGSHALPLGRGR